MIEKDEDDDDYDSSSGSSGIVRPLAQRGVPKLGNVDLCVGVFDWGREKEQEPAAAATANTSERNRRVQVFFSSPWRSTPISAC